MKIRFSLLGLLLMCLLATAWADSYDEDNPDLHWAETEMDTAWLTFLQNNDSTASDYSITFLSDLCYKCEPTTEFIGNQTRKVKVSTQHKWTITLKYTKPTSPNSVILDELHVGFVEHGRYELSFQPGMPGAKFKLHTKAQGTFSLLPVVVALSICAGACDHPITTSLHQVGQRNCLQFEDNGRWIPLRHLASSRGVSVAVLSLTNSSLLLRSSVGCHIQTSAGVGEAARFPTRVIRPCFHCSKASN